MRSKVGAISNLHLYKGEMLLSVLAAFLFFSIIFLSLSQWQSQQRRDAVRQYHYYQAIQIAEMQWQLQFLGLPCDTHIKQNNAQFTITCNSNL